MGSWNSFNFPNREYILIKHNLNKGLIMIRLELSDEDFELLSYLVITYQWHSYEGVEATEQFKEMQERFAYLKDVRDKVHITNNQYDRIPSNTSINVVYHVDNEKDLKDSFTVDPANIKKDP